MVLTISNEEFIKMESAVPDKDHAEALALSEGFIKAIEQQRRQGLKSHLDT